MITENVLRRTLLLKFGDNLGTGFLVDKDGKQYLVTAKHVVDGFQEGQQLEIGYRGDWLYSKPVLIGHATEAIDISVLSLEKSIVKGQNIIHDTPVKLDDYSDMCVFGQDVYFLGFPFGMYTDAGELNNHFPMPIIKKAIYSGNLADVGASVVLLDGVNNIGFSGGPVVHRNPLDPKSRLYVMSVISGYRTHGADVYYKEEATPFKIRENTGIIISYGIRHALEIIDANPKGILLT